jgi:CBS domain
MKRPNESQTAQEPVATHGSETMLPVRVAEIMARDVITVHPDQTLADAISLIAAHHFHHLVVTDAGGKVVGIISDRDLLRAVARTQDWHSCYIRDVMTANPVTIDAETPISVAATKMLMNRFNSLRAFKSAASASTRVDRFGCFILLFFVSQGVMPRLKSKSALESIHRFLSRVGKEYSCQYTDLKAHLHSTGFQIEELREGWGIRIPPGRPKIQP